jgi:hypothetical protein
VVVDYAHAATFAAALYPPAHLAQPAGLGDKSAGFRPLRQVLLQLGVLFIAEQLRYVRGEDRRFDEKLLQRRYTIDVPYVNGV